ncbi:helix-turn-helix transcriptional regulator [Actinomadura rupiterrae]|uniref:helix-turn-helix transcriptional regulator n=1 Tax=Actinomadura rupiterrae TaxID=559627 RepID=UPI0020A45657|nr:WYL domain-containing protein [Actinomadura rupiterrae]MCP2343209.1 putative DNA-binding transcriptional regulator YafY [Actinomadura rupiterrae]
MSTTERALHLLELLQARRSWAGGELAGRLGVDGRTLRRDVERLRALGYRIEARRGPDGGYRLSTGGDLPPLVFTPDEALAVAAALASSAASGAADGGEVALTALAKMEQVMPAAVRRRVRALRSSVAFGGTPNAAAGAYPAPLDADVLGVLALACRDAERVRLTVMNTGGPTPGRETARHVEPAALVPRHTRWFLVCRDLDDGWRVLRVDRITRAAATGARFEPQEVPGGDPVAFVTSRLGAPPREHAATILIHAPIEQVQAYMGGFAADFAPTTAADGRPATLWRIADVRLEVLAGGLLWVRWPFEVLDSPELAALLRDRAAAFTFAADHAAPSHGGTDEAPGEGSRE